eukprot:GFYU01005198.1.p1 GENE.GFYU01005198.1~~GFYU01005198.1.p1  ORF type:complete len:218 (-),score=46.26 GFYU01005198.1:380-1033(-)
MKDDAPPSPAPSSEVAHKGARTDNRLKIPPVLDFGFCEVTVADDFRKEESKDGRWKMTITYDDNGEPVEHMGSKVPTTSLKLNNNLLTSVTGLAAVFNQIVLKPIQITWIDLSFNDLDHIESEFCKFTNLRVLYLHGNNFEHIEEVRRLESLPLRSLTLHGTPMVEKKKYRLRAIMYLPKLRSLDFTAVTAIEKDIADTTKKSQQRSKELKAAQKAF